MLFYLNFRPLLHLQYMKIHIEAFPQSCRYGKYYSTSNLEVYDYDEPTQDLCTPEKPLPHLSSSAPKPKGHPKLFCFFEFRKGIGLYLYLLPGSLPGHSDGRCLHGHPVGAGQVQCSAVQCSAVQCCIAAQCSAVQCSAGQVPYITVQ